MGKNNISKLVRCHTGSGFSVRAQFSAELQAKERFLEKKIPKNILRWH